MKSKISKREFISNIPLDSHLCSTQLSEEIENHSSILNLKSKLFTQSSKQEREKRRFFWGASIYIYIVYYVYLLGPKVPEKHVYGGGSIFTWRGRKPHAWDSRGRCLAKICWSFSADKKLRCPKPSYKTQHENHHDSHFLALVAAFGRDNLISGKGSFRRFSCRVGVRQPYTSYGRTASRPCHRSGGSPVSLHRLVQDPQIISNAIAPMLKVTLWILVLIC